MDDLETVRLWGPRQGGKRFYETVAVDRLGDNRFRLRFSPGFVLGLAAGDEFELAPDEFGGYRVLKRGGNVCIQLFSPGDAPTLTRKVEPVVQRAGGRVDGEFGIGGNALVVITFPVTVGFSTIETVMRVVDDNSWNYANTHDPRDGSPLLWWSGFTEGGMPRRR